MEDFPQLGVPYVDPDAATAEADSVIPYEVLNLMRQYDSHPVPIACLLICFIGGIGCHVSRGRTVLQKVYVGHCVHSDLYAVQCCWCHVPCMLLVSHVELPLYEIEAQTPRRTEAKDPNGQACIQRVSRVFKNKSGTPIRSAWIRQA